MKHILTCKMYVMLDYNNLFHTYLVYVYKYSFGMPLHYLYFIIIIRIGIIPNIKHVKYR